jgi:hypothetical protein
MPIKYSCFVSYCHGQHEVINGFVTQLKQALKSYLELYLDEEVYIDEERLKPGYQFNEELSKAICQSVCMIVVYSPTYEKHSYCLREFAAMEYLENARWSLLGSSDKPGLIIPIILRGKDDLPPRIKSCTHYSDFSQFTLATTRLSKNPKYVKEIEKIVDVIYEHYKTFSNPNVDVCSVCESFEIPPEEDVLPWREQQKFSVSPFPGR